jgi:hypothetical protein
MLRFVRLRLVSPGINISFEGKFHRSEMRGECGFGNAVTANVQSKSNLKNLYIKNICFQQERAGAGKFLFL